MIVSLERRKALAYRMSLFELLSWEVRKVPGRHIIPFEKVEEFFSSQHSIYCISTAVSNHNNI
jgi:hypothetical protein